MNTQTFAAKNNLFNVTNVRANFPILQQKIHDKPLVYLDNAATTQKPLSVINAISEYYLQQNANVHRGVHQLSEQATFAFENARKTIQQFIHAKHAHEIIFVRGVTEAINLLAYGWEQRLQAGDEILISAMEHHSNIVPWQVICAKKNAKLRVIPITEKGEIDLIAYQQLLNERTKLVAVTHISNVLGTINPIAKIITLAHAQNIPVLIDGAQATPHMPIDVQALDADFYVFSGHKMYGPTGIGILYGKEKLLEQLPPYQTGGGMISQVSFDKTFYQGLPEKFEAGTPNIAGAIGLQAAIKYLQQLDLQQIALYEAELLNYATQQLQQISDIKIIGQATEKSAVISFVMQQAHPHDVGTILDSEGIAIRAGHHCCMPLMDYFKLPATVRVSLGIYNTQDEIDKLIKGLIKVINIFGTR